MKIKKLYEGILYKKIRTKHTFQINDKRIEVIASILEDNMDNDYYSDTEILNESKLTDVELEEFGCYIAENLDLKEGEEWDTDKDTN